MAKDLTILELTNPMQLFGARNTAYAMFDANCEGTNVVIGITHNALSRKGYDTSAESLNRLVGFTITTKDFTDQDGVVVSGDERVDMVLRGEGRIVLFNSNNCAITQTEEYKQQQLELQGIAKAKVQMDKEREILFAKRQANLARLAGKATPTAPTQSKSEEAVETVEATQEAELTFNED